MGGTPAPSVSVMEKQRIPNYIYNNWQLLCHHSRLNNTRPQAARHVQNADCSNLPAVAAKYFGYVIILRIYAQAKGVSSGGNTARYTLKSICWNEPL